MVTQTWSAPSALSRQLRLTSTHDKNHPSPIFAPMHAHHTPVVGILGGGQLGRMLLQAAANYPVKIHVLENDASCPSAHLCHRFVKGDITNFEDVYNFGKGLDAITIEIEHVNIEALEKLEADGVKVYPRPGVLRTIKNKILQKEFYKEKEIPTAAFHLTLKKDDVSQYASFLPAVHKLAEGGYDGKGVQILRNEKDFDKAFNAPAVLEKLIPIHKEISQVVAINEKGDTALYPPVEMVFDPHLNLLDYQLCPAEIETSILWKVEAIALSVVRNFHSPGIYAVELLIDRQGNVFVNETAPRVHNSGHHTIEGNYCSQFDMLWRVILGYPLGNTAVILPSIMINILGAEEHDGEVWYEGLEDVLKIENAFVHLYGKAMTKPGRKMGHVTVISREKQDLLHKSNKIKRLLFPKTRPL